jgi:hypothetical protein
MSVARALRPSSVDTGLATLVWVDAREAVLARWVHGEIAIDRISSTVPVHTRAIGHIRHDPGVRHGGGLDQRALDHQRDEHIARFLDEVQAALPDAGPIEILGPGTIRERLARGVDEADGRAGRSARVISGSADHPTDAQLIARLRELVGRPPRRRRPRT